MPNRFFRAGFSLHFVNSTPGAALLYDQRKAYGEKFSIQPRLGGSYVLAEYRNFKVELAMGTYYEISRIQTISNRLHGTFSLEVNPYFINTGVGADLSSTYKNWMLSVGIDIVRLARTFAIIPPDTVPPLRGTFPPMFEVDADGLATGFTQGEPKSVAPPSAEEVSQIVKDIPKRIEERLEGKPTPVPKPPAHKKKKKKKR